MIHKSTRQCNAAVVPVLTHSYSTILSLSAGISSLALKPALNLSNQVVCLLLLITKKKKKKLKVVRVKNRKELQELLETRISLSDSPADVFKDSLGTAPRQLASDMQTSETSSTPAIRQAPGEVATASQEKRKRKIHTESITRGMATHVVITH